MLPDKERIGRIKTVLAKRNWDALVCALPANVLLLSGYWPVTGSAIAVATREGAVAVLAPGDEQELAKQGWAGDIRTFESGSLHNLQMIVESVVDPLCNIRDAVHIRSGTVIGFEDGASFDPASYASTFVYGAGMQRVLTAVFPSVAFEDATADLARLRSALTNGELDRVREACSIAQKAFVEISSRIAAGMRELDAAALLRSKLESEVSGGFGYCMSGPNSAEAYKAYQRSSSRTIGPGDFVLLHCNSYRGGYWTDITRTFCVGEPDAEKSKVIDAVIEASRCSIEAVRPGVEARIVDHAARQMLEDRGFGKFFKHATGHGVGFAAINHNALPRIHPLSTDVLETGMVFNIEPAVYVEGHGGMRHCTMVAVASNGVEVLTPFVENRADLILN